MVELPSWRAIVTSYNKHCGLSAIARVHVAYSLVALMNLIIGMGTINAINPLKIVLLSFPTR